MSIVSNILKIIKYSKFTRREVQSPDVSLDLDGLAREYNLEIDKVGQLIEVELGWSYQPRIVLRPEDFWLDTSKVSKLSKYSAIVLTEQSGGLRVLTSKPDLILESHNQIKKYFDESLTFQISSKLEIDNSFNRLLGMRKTLERAEESDRNTLIVFVVSLLDCLDLGVSTIVYRGEGYVASKGSDQYAGALSSEIVAKILSFFVSKTPEFFENLMQELGILNEVSLESVGSELVISCKELELLASSKIDQQLKHILLVDDDQRFIGILRRGIALKGFKVSVANSVEQALSYMNRKDEEVDLIVCDYFMPNQQGSSLVSAIRSADINLPIIGLTADSQSESVLSFINAGVSAVVRKSDDPKILIAWIFKLLNN